MMLAQLRDARAQAAKRPAVRRQHQRVGRHRLVARERIEVERERIAFRLEVEHRDVGRDTRQHHVPGDQQPLVGAVQRGVLGRVPEARHHLPAARADGQRVAVAQPAVARRHGRHQLRVVASAAAQLAELGLVGQAVPREMLGRRVAARVRAVARGHHVAEQVFAERHPEPHLPAPARAALADPVREPEVVGMAVRDDHAQHRQAVQVRVEDVFPVAADLVRGDPAVHHGPARLAVEFVAQQPEIDVVERERQRHAQPPYAGRHLQVLARLGQRVGERIVELLFQCVHVVSCRAPAGTAEGIVARF